MYNNQEGLNLENSLAVGIRGRSRGKSKVHVVMAKKCFLKPIRNHDRQVTFFRNSVGTPSGRRATIFIASFH